MRKEIRKLIKETELNNTEIALTFGKYSTPAYYYAMQIANELRGAK